MRALFISGVFALLASLGSRASAQDDKSQKFLKEKLLCPTPAVAQFEPWGKSGTQQICKIKHGPFAAFEDGYVHIRGQYENGKPAGIWSWYDANGKVIRTEDHSKGR